MPLPPGSPPARSSQLQGTPVLQGHRTLDLNLPCTHALPGLPSDLHTDWGQSAPSVLSGQGRAGAGGASPTFPPEWEPGATALQEDSLVGLHSPGLGRLHAVTCFYTPTQRMTEQMAYSGHK